MEMRNKIRIGVIGGASPDPKYRQIAFEVGQQIGEKEAISLAVELVRNGDCDAIVSAGHTGAAVAASTVRLGLP